MEAMAIGIDGGGLMDGWREARMEDRWFEARTGGGWILVC